MEKLPSLVIAVRSSSKQWQPAVLVMMIKRLASAQDGNYLNVRAIPPCLTDTAKPDVIHRAKPDAIVYLFQPLLRLRSDFV